MSIPLEILDTIDAVAGHQRTGTGKVTVRNLTAELREYFGRPEEVVLEDLAVEESFFGEVATEQDVGAAEELYAEAPPVAGCDDPANDPVADEFNDAVADIPAEDGTDG